MGKSQEEVNNDLLSGRWLQVLRVGWSIIAVISLGILVTSLPGYAARILRGLPGHGPTVNPSTIFVYLQAFNTFASLAAAMLSFFLAVLLYRRKFANPAAAAISFYLLLYCVVMTGPLEAWTSYWLGNQDMVLTLQTILVAAPTVAWLVLFPNGKFVPPWTRWLLAASLIWTCFSFFIPLEPGQSEGNTFGIVMVAVMWVIILGLSIYAQVHRYRHSSTHNERQQTKWVLFGFSMWFGFLIFSTFPYFYLEGLPAEAPLPWWAGLSELGWWLSLMIVPLSLAIAILSSRLWNIDLVINRTLVYGALTLATMSLYVLIVATLGNLLHVGNNMFIAFLTTGLVAVLFQPMRERLQNSVNRMMYGERDDPVAVLTELGDQLEHTGSPDDALADIVQTVSQALKLPFAAIELGGEKEFAAAFGIPKTEILRLPLVYQSETTGYLIVAPRAPGEAFNQQDWQLLENIAHQAGAAAHAAKLTADLRLSRQRLVTAREEERRRLRRDLHDGLGPTLASLTLKLDAARNLLRENPDRAEDLLADLKAQTQETIQDIRSLVYELRPPALDELGLIGAIQSFINGKLSSPLDITLDVPQQLPPLMAAFEVAIYRIILEALTNVERHASANQAIVRILIQDCDLCVDVFDDGVGMSDSHPVGVGLASMRERAEELGGAFDLVPTARGTHIRARLPLPEE